MPNSYRTRICECCNNEMPNYSRVLLHIPSTNELGYVCYECHNRLSRECSNGEIYSHNCPECGHLCNIVDFRDYGDNSFICVSCYREIYWYCRRCDQEFTHTDVRPVLAIDDYNRELTLCMPCAEAFNNENIIHQYDYVPKPIFYKEENEYMNLLYIGIELELECCGNNKYELAKALPDFVYAKNDGSLDSGFEIVSHPTTYRWLMNHKTEWNTMLDIRKMGWRSFNTKTCGMHIHLSKIAFGNHHLYKFMKLFYSNPTFILKISQRDSKTNLKQWSSIELTERRIRSRAKEKQTFDHEDRYTAVNLNTPDTVEVRIFRGTLLAESFWKNIEFVKACYEFSYKYNSNYMTEIAFRKYLRVNRKEFKNLYSFLYEDNSLKVYNEGVQV